MQMLGSSNRTNTSGSGQPANKQHSAAAPASGTPQSQSAPQSMGNEPPMDFDDDIPFLGYGYGVCRGALYGIS